MYEFYNIIMNNQNNTEQLNTILQELDEKEQWLNNQPDDYSFAIKQAKIAKIDDIRETVEKICKMVSEINKLASKHIEL